ncbi:MAG: Asp-tRNA(Asn)/Glu-tRNA(Gln) amidotransferase subunit GatA [Phycisphaerales bacterium]
MTQVATAFQQHDKGHRTASDIAASVNSRAQSATDIVRDALKSLDTAEKSLHACIDTFHDAAIKHASKVDELIAGGKRLPLAGVPVVIKDNICIGPSTTQHASADDAGKLIDASGYGGRTTCASRMLADYRSPYTATAAQRLMDAGAIVLAKTNLDEFAMGSSCEHSCFGPTCNPWDTSRVPGGSSGGSAALVGAGVVPLSLGSDTGGSIRQPASFCGIVGVKPTYGRVSRYGLVAYASSLDQIGPMTRSVHDAALSLEVLCGIDKYDATSIDRPDTEFLADLERPVQGLTLGVPRQARQLANQDASEIFENALVKFREAGAKIVDVDIPLLDDAVAAYYIVAPAEASSNLARFDGIRYGRRATLEAGEGLFELYCKSRSEGFGPEVRRRILLGTHVLSSGYYDAYYNTALKVRRKLLHQFEGVFGGVSTPKCHAILTPTTPGPAFRIGEKTSDPMSMYLEDVYTVAINLAGLPAMSMPSGFVTEKNPDGKSVQLPLGLQIIAPAFEESMMLRIARMFERVF